MIRRVFAALILMCAVSITPLAATAASPVTQFAICSGGAANFFGFQPWYACLPKSCPNAGPNSDDGTPKLCSLSDVYKIIFPIVDWILKGAVFVSAGMMFFMLFKIATSRGNASQYSTAISGIRDAVVGLLISVLAVAILNFVVGAF
jgi:hypothetical protein